MPETPLQLDRVDLTYGSGQSAVPALRSISIGFEYAELALVMGASGSGKSSLLSILGCLLSPDSGDVRMMGRTISGLSETERAAERRERIGFVFQSFRLFSTLSAIDNILLVLEINGVRGPAARGAAQRALAAVGLEGIEDRKPHELSGGERQRVAIARALVKNPPVILADEPTASLDSDSGAQVATILKQLSKQRDRVVVVVTHDTRLLRFGSRIIRMEDGRITSDDRSSADA